MKRCPTLHYRAVFAALLLTLMAVSAFAQIQSSTLYGNVVGNDGAALPGVTVTLTGVGAPQVVVTDEQGRFRFPNLPPGTYTLKAELAGYGTATRAGIGVRLGASPDVTLTLNPSVAQTITVTAEAPLIDVRKTGTGATMSKIELETIPSGRDPWVILQQTPGVLIDRINVGGNESGQQSSFTGKGSFTEQTAWNVDGVNITDVGALGSSPTYYDFDSFEEMQIATGGSDPRIQTPGVQVNMVTKRVTNDLSGSARYFSTKNSWQSDPKIPADAEAVYDTNGNLVSGYLRNVNEIDDISDMGIEAGGPIIRDRLWLWGAYSDQQIDLLTATPAPDSLSDDDVRHLTDQTELETFNAKLNAQPVAANSLSLAAMLGNKVKFGRNVGPTRPQDTGWNQDNTYGGPTMWKVEDTHVFNSSFYLTGLYSKVQGGFQLISDNGERCTSIECGLSGAPATWDYGPGPDRIWDTDDDGDTLPHNSYYNYYTERPQDQYRLDGSTFFNAGDMSHELKFGFGVRDADVRSLSAWPGDRLIFLDVCPQELVDSGDCVATSTFQANKFSDFTYNVKSTDFYVGDTILLGNLTLQASLRWDNQASVIEGGVVPVNNLLPDVLPTIHYDSEELEWSTISPRVGLTYALGADKKTLLRAAANRYVDQMGGYSVYGVSPAAYGYVAAYFNDLNGDRDVQPNEIVPESIYNALNLDPNNPGVPVRRWDDDLEAPHTDEFLMGFEREVLTDFVIGLNGTFRKMYDIIELAPEKTPGAGDFYTRDDYELLRTVSDSVANDGPSYSVDVYELKCILRNDAGECIERIPAPTYFVFRNRPDYSQTYKGLELMATKRMSSRWMMRGSFTWQDWTQNVGEDSFSNPTRLRDSLTGNCTTCDGDQVVQGSGTGSGAKGGIYINSKWAYTVTGAYQIPVIETSFGFNLQGRQGYPIPYIARVGTTEGRQPVLLDENIDAHRLPNVHNLDLRVAKDLRLGPVGLTVSADMFNVFNRNTELQRNVTNSNSTATDQNRIAELLSPRVFRLGARLTF
jgi:hypothetical protein